jgi:hypothetical protein
MGLRRFLQERGRTLVVTSDKDGDESMFAREQHRRCGNSPTCRSSVR